MRNCIFTPTYEGHFCYIKKYLESFALYVEDASSMPICFMLSSKSEINAFSEIIKPYEGNLDITVYVFDEVIKNFGITIDTEEILKKYGHTSYQMLKKFYGMLYIDAEYFLVLDSEAAWIRQVNMGELLQNFIENPFVVVSDFESRKSTSTFLKNHFAATNYILGYELEKMPFEHFMWIYSKKIINDVIKEYGQPYDMMLKVYEWEMKQRGSSVGLMETMLILNYIYKNADILGYRVICAEKELEKYLGIDGANEYISKFFKVSNGGKLGILEFPCDLLSNDNALNLSRLFKENNIWITRCDTVTYSNKKYITKFVNDAGIAILAVGQDHIFLPGITQKDIKNIVFNHSLQAIKLKVRGLIKKDV